MYEVVRKVATGNSEEITPITPKTLWTLRSPGDKYKNQMDYKTINKRFRKSVRRVKTFPGADCGRTCDHVPVMTTVKLKFRRINRARKRVRKNW